LKFILHNIQYGNGKRTMGRKTPLEQTQKCQAIIRTLNSHYPKEQRASIRVADLGCLEGGYTVAFARNGYNALGIEAREENLAKCRFIKDQLKLDNLTFVKEDVKKMERFGQFDVIFCSGLLYHLDKPAEFINLIGKLATKMVIIQTHYAQPIDNYYDNKSKAFLNRVKWKLIGHQPLKVNYNLSTLTTNEGKKGRWFYEYEEETSRAEIEHNLKAAFSNRRSFWLTKRELLKTIKEAGFSIVYEQYDFLEDIVNDKYIEIKDRSLFIGIKT